MHRASLKNTLHAILANYVIAAGYNLNWGKNRHRITRETNICVQRLMDMVDTAVRDESEQKEKKK